MNRSPSTICLSVLVLIALSGCAGREHMSEDYGRQSRSFFAKQRVYDAPVAGSSEGLDSEEAAAIRDRYHEQLAPEEKDCKSDNMSQVLVLQEAQQDGKGKH